MKKYYQLGTHFFAERQDSDDSGDKNHVITVYATSENPSISYNVIYCDCQEIFGADENPLKQISEAEFMRVYYTALEIINSEIVQLINTQNS